MYDENAVANKALDKRVIKINIFPIAPKKHRLWARPAEAIFFK